MGVSQLEAGVLSGKTTFCEIPGALRGTPEYRRDQLYLPSLSDRKTSARMARRNTTGLSVRGEGQSENHAHEPAAKHRGVHRGFSERAGTAGDRKETRTGAVSASAVREGRCRAAARLSRDRA